MILAMTTCLVVLVVIAMAAEQQLQAGKVEVDVSRVLRPVERRIIGINTNYLMDGEEKLHAGRGLEAALREMGVKCLRFPGGDKSDSHLWSVPPFDAPRPTLARSSKDEWPAKDERVIGPDGKTYIRVPLDFDQFMEICQNLGAEPICCVCYDGMYGPVAPGGFAPTRDQLLETAVEWVRYANVVRGYGVKYWEIGNETYFADPGPSAEEYARDVVLFSRAMKEVDPTILVGPNGPNDPEDRGAADKKAGREVSWWKAVLGIASADIDFLALHDYPCWKWRRYEAYIDKEPTFGGAAGGGVATLTRYCAAEDAERIRVAMTEVNSADWSASFEDKKGWPHVNTLGHGVVLFDIIGSYLLHPKVDLLCVWNTRWTENDIAQELWDALSPQNELWPTGRAIAIWGQFVRDNMVFAEAGSGMRAFASHAPASGELSVFLVNKGLEAQPVTVTLNGYAPGSPAERWVFTGSEPEDLNPTWSREEDVEVQGESFSVDLPPVCVTVVALKSGESAD